MIARQLAEQLVKHQAENEIGKWWESYSSPFKQFGKQAFGSKAEGIQGNFGQAVGNLVQQRPKTMLGMAGLGLGGLLGSTEGVPRWMLALGMLGLGGGALYSQRDKLGPMIQKYMQPTIASARKEMEDAFSAQFQNARTQLNADIEKHKKDLQPVIGAATAFQGMKKYLPGNS